MKFFNQYSALLGNQELLKKRVQNWKRLHIYTWILVSRIKFPFAEFYKRLLIGSLNHNEITQFTSTEFPQSYHRNLTIMYIDESLFHPFFTLIHYHLERKYLNSLWKHVHVHSAWGDAFSLLWLFYHFVDHFYLPGNEWDSFGQNSA